TALPLRPPSFHPPHERSAPSVWCRVPDGAEHRYICRGGERAGPKLKGWFQREPRRMFQPSLVVFEGGGLLVIAHPCPKASHQVCNAFQFHIHQRFPIHHFPLAGVCLRAPRIRFGRFSSSSCSPTGSFLASAISASLSVIPKTNSTVA